MSAVLSLVPFALCCVIAFFIFRRVVRDMRAELAQKPQPIRQSTWYGRPVTPKQPWLGPEDDPNWRDIAKEIMSQ